MIRSLAPAEVALTRVESGNRAFIASRNLATNGT